MSFSLQVPKSQGEEEFAAKMWDAKATPKADGRTKVGRLQNDLVRVAKHALDELAYPQGDHTMSGSISGHVHEDLSATVSVSLSLHAE